MVNELVTICLTTYNRDFLIEDSISNILKQTYKNIELIIVDDHSTDRTELICKNLVKITPNTIYIRHDFNKGLASARNTAIKSANGKYFTFIDDDDSWEPNFIEEFVKLATNYDSNWCFCCGVKYIKDKYTAENLPNFNGYLKDYFVLGYTPPVASQFYFTQTLLEVGGYDETVLTCVDHDLWLKLSIKGIKIKGLSLALAIPNDDLSLERMTTNKEKRLSKLEDTFAKWESTIVEHYGLTFFNKFTRAYREREQKKFLFKILTKEGLKQGLLYFYKNINLFTFKESFKIFTKYLLSNVNVNFNYSHRKQFFTPSLKIAKE